MTSPFIRKAIRDDQKGLTIKDIFGARAYNGEVGLEIEVEGNAFPKYEEKFDEYGDVIERHRDPNIPDQWDYTHDGSLRGEDNAEYILAGPTMFDEVPEAIDDLWQMFEDFGSVLDDSNRTSIHVHLNVQDWHLDRLCSFVAMYLIVEDVFTHWCGDHRVGNLFCLRAKDAPGIVSRLSQLFQHENGFAINGGMHYSGLNAHALKKLGSIEVRTMRGVKDPELIKTWVGVLERLYHLSGDVKDPRDVVSGFSGRPRADFLSDLLGPFTSQILEGCGMNSHEVSESLREGIRIAQRLCYCRDWSKYEKQEAPDVFGRSNVPEPEPQAEGPSVPSVPVDFMMLSSTGVIEELFNL
jgi:hypothetical protein